LPDDIAPDDARVWRDAWVALAVRADRWIEVRVLALDTSAALERAATAPGHAPASIGVALDIALADRDPAFRFAAIHDVPAPVPDAMRPLLVKAIESDTDNDAARAAAQVLCFDSTAGLTPAAIERAKTLGVKRCLTKR
jgi:hypothetical protein